VLGSAQTPSFLTASSGEFWNFESVNPKTGDPEYWDWPVHPSTYTGVPQLAWDTFPTIGFVSSFDQGGVSGAATVFDHFRGNWVNTSESWTHGSNPAPGNAVPGGPSGFRVGLFQATVAAGTQVSGQFALDTGYGLIWGDNTMFTTIPAPPPIALGVIGVFLIGPGRRRSR
jgi:hypothetical protein